MAKGRLHSREAPSQELLTLAASPPQPPSVAHFTPALGPPSPSPFPAGRVHWEDRGWEGGPGLLRASSFLPSQLQRLFLCRWLSVWILSSANPFSCTTWRSSSQRAGQGWPIPFPSPLAAPRPCSAARNCPFPHQIPHPSLPQPGRAPG